MSSARNMKEEMRQHRQITCGVRAKRKIHLPTGCSNLSEPAVFYQSIMIVRSYSASYRQAFMPTAGQLSAYRGA